MLRSFYRCGTLIATLHSTYNSLGNFVVVYGVKNACAIHHTDNSHTDNSRAKTKNVFYSYILITYLNFIQVKY